MDSVAAEASVSKRTLYDRFPSKIHLFEAALHHRATLDFESFRKFDLRSELLDAILHDMAEWLMDRILGERNIALYRLLAAEAHRVPELSDYMEEKVLQPIVGALTALFRQAIDRGEVIDLPAEFLANQFLQAMCGQQVRERLYGVPRVGHRTDMDEWTRDEWTRNALRLFLNGVRSLTDGQGAAAS